MSGLVLNGERPFDMAAERDPRVELEGDVHLLMNMPRDLNSHNNVLNPWQRVRLKPKFLPLLNCYVRVLWSRR